MLTEFCFLLTVLVLAVAIAHSPCPCETPELCLPINIQHELEVFGFIDPSVEPSWYHDEGYDLTQLTSIAWSDDVTLVCRAHYFGTRVYMKAEVDADLLSQMSDPQKRKGWIQKQVAKAKSRYLDGINFDLEIALLPSDDLTQTYTTLVKETSDAFHSEIVGSQVSIDLPWSPFDTDGRNYNWTGLSDSADILFIMVYDTQSQMWGRCVASANAPSSVARRSLNQWIHLVGLPPSKLILGLPWYGYKYPCVGNGSSDVCVLSPVPFAGAPCSDAAGSQVTYGSIVEILRTTNATVKWDSLQESPYFDYREGGQRFQVWYDDPSSLAIKYEMAANYGIRGVGMWHLEALDYSDPSAGEMWEALKVFTRPQEHPGAYA